MGNTFLIDKRLARDLSGPDKLRALLRARYRTMQRFAQAHGLYPQQVGMTLDGDRAYPEIRDALAAALDLPRAEIDQLIDGDAERSRIPA